MLNPSWKARARAGIAKLSGALTAGVLATASVAAAAQSDPAARYPEQPVRLVVVYQAGGANDIVARVLGERMSASLGQQVVVVNKPGANGAIGAQFVAAAQPDGYTVLMGGVPLVVARALYKHPPVDFEKSLVPVGKAVDLSLVLVARKQYPAQTFQQMVERERKQPGSTSMAITASAYEFYHARINKLAGTNFLKVPYAGVPAAMNDLNGNRVDLLIDTLAAQKPFLEAGSTRPLAVFGPRRLAALPNVPTLGELGLKGFEDQPYVGMLVPRGTPDGVVRKLNQALNGALAQPEVKARLEALSFVVSPGTPESFHKEMKADSDRFVEVGQLAGIEKQ